MRGLSPEWKSALRAVVHLGAFSLDQLSIHAPHASRGNLRATVHNLCKVGYLERKDDGRYDLTGEGIEKILEG